MPLADLLLGRPLSSSEERTERLGVPQAVPTFGLDALSSAAYGPEAALTILLSLGVAGIHWILPLSTAIVILLTIVYFSYRQTIAAYPGGGGSYTVAKENLGARAGLLAGAALMIDYLLNVAVGISAGVGALVSAVPALEPHTLQLCLIILAILTIVNLRGTREPGALFMAPTYLFVACLLIDIGRGAMAVAASGGHPHPIVAPPHVPPALEAAGLWLLLKAFASGCTAMTGVEAVSNGVQAFREPVVANARKTLTVIIGILIVLLTGIAWLANAYAIGATPPGQAGYQSVLSQLTGAVAGRGIFYYVTIASILTVLSLSANTSFAGFPRLCRAAAEDCYLPRSFANRGRRLVYSEGIWVLALLAGLLLVIFGGITDRLIPLFAVGAFLAFTLSQAGMVAHWKKKRGRGSRTSMLVNGVGALATGATVLVVLTAKFAEGAWVVVLLIPLLIALMSSIHRHYQRVDREIAPKPELYRADLKPPLVVLPVEAWSTAAQNAFNFALALSADIEILHVEYEGGEELTHDWRREIAVQARSAGRPVPKLTILRSPFRFVVQPVVDHVLSRENEHPDRTIAVVIGALVERHWYHYFLHNQRGELLTALLLLKGKRRIAIVNVPWYLRA